MCLGRRKVHHFCKTTTSQISGAAIAAPAAPLSTPLLLQIITKDIDNEKVRCVLKTVKMLSLCPDSRSSHLTTGFSHGRQLRNLHLVMSY